MEAGFSPQSAACKFAELREQVIGFEAHATESLKAYVGQCEYRSMDVMVGEILAFKAVVKLIDELSGKEAEMSHPNTGD